MGVTIRDVAKHASVSVATVSRALRGHASVSTATRERVEAAAAALHYTLPFRADHGQRGRTLRVAVVVPHIGRWYFSKVIEGIESVIADREGDLMLYRPFDRQNRRRSLLDVLDTSVVDAAIVVALPVTDAEVAGLRDRGVALSLLGTTHPHVSSVGIDDVAAAQQLTAHFIDLGHTRIGLISSAPFDPTPTIVATNRRAGFRAALAAAGLRADPELEVDTDFSIRGAQRAVERLFSLASPPTAIVAESDELAFGVMAAARSHGLAVPGDLSVGGIDGHEIGEVWGLTTMAQPVTSLGEVAAWAALATAGPATTVTMPTSLVVRGSSRRPADAQPSTRDSTSP